MGKSSDWVRPGARCWFQGKPGKIVRLTRIAHRQAWVTLDDDDNGPYSLWIEDLSPVDPVIPAETTVLTSDTL